ncbi:MAG: C-terminal binding protein [Rhodospirillales bacterium]|nr:C-terminal binding protein [Rhodospirillales bacterium]
MKPKVLRTDAELFIIEQYMAQLDAVARVVTAASDAPDVLAREAADASVILTCYAEIPAPVIEAAPGLKGIVKYGVGVDNIDVEAATRAGVRVVNCPDYGSDTVADHAFALLIGLARRLTAIDRAMRDKAWVWPAPQFLGFDLAGKTLGLIGLGRIGRAMARRGAGFAMDIVAYDPYVDAATMRGLGVEPADLDALLAGADFVSIHCVLTPQTRGLLGAAELARMKESAFLIDVSRGAIVDEAALVAALRAGRLAGAGFDVFPDEPLKPGHPLLGMDSVILTPHLAWYTHEAFERVERQTLDSVLDVLAGRRPANLKNVEVLTR